MNEVRVLLDAFDGARERGERCAIATVVSVEGSAYRQPGARMLVCESGSSVGTISAGCLERDVVEHAKRVIAAGIAKIVEYDNRTANDEMAWGLGLGCNGIVRILIEPVTRASAHIEALRRSRDEPVTIVHENGFAETIQPPVPLIIFGAGPDVVPVVELAHRIGWHTEVVDPQGRPASVARFAIADKVTLARPEDLAKNVMITDRTMVLVMTHDYAQDAALLKFVIASPARYVGVMGASERTRRMLSGLSISDADRTRIHAPVGLDIGANGPAEIALSIVAEIRAVLDGRCGGMLRDRAGAIHEASSDRGAAAVVAA